MLRVRMPADARCAARLSFVVAVVKSLSWLVVEKAT